MIKKSHLILAGILVVLSSAIVSYAVSAAVPETVLAAGSTRYAVASTTSSTSTSSSTMVDLPSLSTHISIPSGKHGDVIIWFCGYGNTPTFASAQAVVNSTVALPSGTSILNSTTYGQSGCFNFYLLNVASGTKTVKMRWKSGGGMTSTMDERNMLVLVNIH